MIQCIRVLLDFCYLARRSAHTTEDLTRMEETLSRFHQLRAIFEAAGVRPDGFSLPRQHALVHYVRSIQLFGSPNGLCSSITESKVNLLMGVLAPDGPSSIDPSRLTESTRYDRLKASHKVASSARLNGSRFERRVPEKSNGYEANYCSVS